MFGHHWDSYLLPPAYQTNTDLLQLRALGPVCELPELRFTFLQLLFREQSSQRKDRLRLTDGRNIRKILHFKHFLASCMT